jgi:cytosine/adenosine deaminase-related metal-dependent hydrolase
MTSHARVVRARWLIPAQGPPVADGAVVAAEGRILRVGPWARVAPHVTASDHVEHLEDAALLPGLVNAHTHLPLTDMAGKFRPTRRFASWIARLTMRRMLRSQAATRDAIAEGARLMAACGTAAAADLTPDAPLNVGLGAEGVAWTVFAEVFGFGERGMERLGKAVAAAEALARAGGVRVGISPHAPYTVGTDVFMAARQAADQRGWPLSTHLHETPDEIAFTQRGEGTLHAWLKGLRLLPGAWRPAGLRPIPMLARAGFFIGPVLVAHANYLEDDEIAVLARSGSSVAWCPRSHAFFKHADHPWRRLLAAGVNVCLGTDSLASSPSLSVLDEARFVLGREPGADPRTLLEMMTVRGARALGLEGAVGDLHPGLAAVAAAVGPLPAGAGDPLEAVLAGDSPVRRVGFAGP